MSNIVSPKILTLPEAAAYIRVSEDWLRRNKNWLRFGGQKVAGKILFPGEGELYERIFFGSNKEGQGKVKKNKSVAVQFHGKPEAVSEQKLCDQNRSEGCGGQAKGGSIGPIDFRADIHKLL